MDTGPQIHVIHAPKSRQAGKTPSQCHIEPVGSGLFDDYESHKGHLGNLSEFTRVSNDSSNRVPVVDEYLKNSKHDNHAVLVPIRRGTELGYFSTMSTAFYLNQ